MINPRLLPGIHSLFYESYSTRVSPSAPIYSVSSILSCVGTILNQAFSSHGISSDLSNRVTTQASSQYDAELVSQISARFTTESRLDALIISSSILNAAAIIEATNQGLNFGSSVLLSSSSLDNSPNVVSNISSDLNCIITVLPQEILNQLLLSSRLNAIVTLVSSAEVIVYLEHMGDKWTVQQSSKEWNIEGNSKVWIIKKNSIATIGN